jgi:replication fork protection complex subunit Csm3/Swi3
MVQSAPSPGAGQRDELDALFDFDAGEDQFSNTGLSTNGNNTRDTFREHSASARRSEGLGLDEEVKIAKKRQPVAKLDATR